MSKQNSQILLWSLPRSGCHLLEKKVFSQQDNISMCWHPFVGTVAPMHELLLNEEEISSEENLHRQEFQSKSVESVQNWRAALQSAQEEQGKILYMHEHPQFSVTIERVMEVLAGHEQRQDVRRNFTSVPEDLLLYPGTVPVITIRHPVLVVPSAFQARDRVSTTPGRAGRVYDSQLIWSRDLYDFYNSYGIEPVVVDADDYMTSEAFVRDLTRKIGLDSQKAITSWPKMSPQQQGEMHPELVKIQKTLIELEGLKPERASKNVDLQKERESWKMKFQGRDWELIEEVVELVMPHYEYLRERRFRA